MKRVLALLLGIFGSAGTVLAVDQDSCLTVETAPPNRGLAPLSTVEAKLIFVYFPQAPAGQDSLLPTWSNWLVDELKRLHPGDVSEPTNSESEDSQATGR